MDNTLKTLRTASGLTQSQLSFLSGIHVTQISRLERGERSPGKMDLSTAAKLAKALGIHAEDLLGE